MRGIVYVALSSDYLKMALASALTLREVNDYTPIIIYTDKINNSIISSLNIGIEKIGANYNYQEFASRQFKTTINELSPFARTLFLDCDIIPIKPITDIWGYPNLSFAPSAMPTVGQCLHIKGIEWQETMGLVGHSHPHYNSGVFVFDRTNKCDKLFKFWNEEWQKYCQYDQLALVRAIHDLELKVCELPSRFNVPSLNPRFDDILIHYSGKTEKNRFWKNISSITKKKVDDISSNLFRAS